MQKSKELKLFERANELGQLCFIFLYKFYEFYQEKKREGD